MRLWTEYEGETIDGAFPLNKLLLPEGRSAFFSTANGKGDPALLRLIECHFDEEEIIARWRCVEALGHPNFLKLERYGQIELDGGPAVYALFEKADANLSEVLALGRLSAKDTAQLATSLVAALEMLHTHGFVHEHVAPQSIFAVGETVKLRSDCIRDAPEGQAGLDVKQRDVHDLAVVVLQALTQQQAIDAERGSALPAPFDKIVRNGMSGAWGLADIRAALGGPAPPETAAVAPVPDRPAVAPPAAKRPEPAPTANPRSSSRPGRTASWNENAVPASIHQELRTENRRFSPGSGLWSTLQWNLKSRLGPRLAGSLASRWLGVVAMLAVLSLLAGWFVAHESRGVGHQGRHTAAPATAPALAGQNTPVRTQQARAVPREQNGDRGSRTQWRVIAYTYNRRDQAQKKAATIASKNPDLRPEVFTPTGRAPYLVTVGGVMNKDDAFAFARKMRSRGLPRDTYAQNYGSTGL
jgi:eukaryotic-like serine/threonine-protein kinase